MDDPQVNEQLSLSRRQFLQGAGVMTAGLVLGGAPGLALGRVGLPRAQAQQAIDVTAAPFGARGDGQTNDRAAFQAAIDAAIQQRKPLWLPRPAVAYRIELDGATPWLDVHGDLTVVGAGRGDTRLLFTQATPNPAPKYAGFYVRNGVNFQIAKCRLEETAHPVEPPFEGFYFEAGSLDHLALIEEVDVDGFTDVVMVPSSGQGDSLGELFLAVRSCDFKSGYQYCIAFWAVERGHKRLHLYDSTFHDNQFSHLIYCHPHNSVHVENCRFDGANKWAFQFQGSAVSGEPEYQRFVGCWFGPRNSRGIITHGGPTTNPRPEITNCLFEASNAVQIRSDVLVDGCYFTNTADAANISPFVASIERPPWEVTLRNCIFAPKRDVLPYIDLRMEGVTANITNCQFYHQGSGAVMALGKGPANVSTISNCLFYVRTDNASQAIGIETDNGRTTITNCRFHGRATGDRAVIVCKSDGTLAADAALELQGCTFQGITAGSLFYVEEGPGNSWRGRISGGNNRINSWLSPAPLLNVAGAQAPFYARLAPVSGPAPLDLLAAPTTVVSSNYDTYRVTGAADIAAIHWWSDDGAADPLFSGTISLGAATPFALVAGGNIQLANGAARRDVATGTTVRLSFDSSTGVWSEVV